MEADIISMITKPGLKDWQITDKLQKRLLIRVTKIRDKNLDKSGLTLMLTKRMSSKCKHLVIVKSAC